MRFRLTLRSMTLDDLELLQRRILSEFRAISRFCEATTAKRIKIVQQCLRQKCSPLKRCIDCVDILRRSSARGVKQEWDRESKLFSSEMPQYLENGRKCVQNYYQL